MLSVHAIEELVNIPLFELTPIGLVETNLQLPLELVIDHLWEVLFGNENVDSLRLVVFDFDRMTRLPSQSLPHFIGELGSHTTILAQGDAK